MQKKPNKFRIGLFVIAGIIALSAILGQSIFSKMFDKKAEIWVMYFDESIKGLDVGSSVVFNGVEIGKVKKINLIISPDTLEAKIPVFVEMLQNYRLEDQYSPLQRKRGVQMLIQKGLRARLATKSYLTGQLMIELAMLPKTPINLVKNAPANMTQIPTVLSPLSELSRGLQDLPLKQIVTRFDNILGNINDILPKINSVLENLDKTANQNASRLGDTMININKALIDVSDMAKAMRNMADYIERHPDSLLKGKGY